MLSALRDRQAVWLLAILFLIAGFHASTVHAFAPPTLAAISKISETNGALTPSLCITGTPAQSKAAPKCDACRLVDAPGLSSGVTPLLAAPVCPAKRRIGWDEQRLSLSARGGIRLPRAPPRSSHAATLPFVLEPMRMA